MTKRPPALIASILSLAIVAPVWPVPATRADSPGCVAVEAAPRADAARPGPPDSRSQPAPGGKGVRLERPRPAVRAASPAPIEYWLPSDATTVTIEILDAAGRVIRAVTGRPGGEPRTESAARRAGEGVGVVLTAPSPTTHAGLNQFMWDLRHGGATPVESTGAASVPPSGPLAVPGTYQVRLTVNGGEPLTQPYVIANDPRLPGTSATDLQAQLDLALKVRDKTSEANQAVLDIRSLKSQIAQRLPGARSPAVGLAAEVVNRRLTEVEAAIYPVSDRGRPHAVAPVALSHRLEALQRSIDTFDGRPPDSAHDQFRTLSGELEAEMSRLKRVLENEVTAFNRLLTNGGQQPLALPPTLPR